MLVKISTDKTTYSSLTDYTGAYKLTVPEKGNYTLNVFKNNVLLSSEELNIQSDINKELIINNGEKLIETITLLSQKKLIERKIDRTVFNINNSSMSLGTNLFDALQQVPMIRADENSGISITGKSNVSVMINNRIINLSSSELISYLKSLNSNDVDKIEVITSPPAKYSAQGNSGLINIVLKKDNTQGFKGTYSSSVISRTWNSFNNNLNLSYKKNKIYTNLKLRYEDYRKRSVENYNIVGPTSSYSNDLRTDFGNSKGASLNLEYKINSQSTVGINSDLNYLHSNMNINNTTNYYIEERFNQTLHTYTENRKKNTSFTLNGYYDLAFGKENKNKLNVLINYFDYDPVTNVNFATSSVNDIDSVRTYSGVNYKVFSGQFDFTIPTKFANIETGARYSSIKNLSNVEYYNFDYDNSIFIENKERANQYNYKEDNYALYISGTKEFEKFSVKAGLRYEYSVIDGKSVTLNKTNTYKYGRLFPTFYFDYNINDDNDISFSYSKRINRPGFRAIDPFRWYSNPYSYMSGNPELMPSYNHNFELNYTYKNSLSIGAYFQRLINGFDQITNLDGMYEVSTYKNFFNQNSFGVDISYNKYIFKWWQGYYTANLAYSTSDIENPSIIAQKGIGINFSITNSLRLNSNKTSYLILAYNHSFPSREGNTYYLQKSSFDIGYRQALLDNKLQLSIAVNDLFRQQKFRGEVYFKDNTQYYNNYYDNRRVTFAVTYNFGALKANNKAKQVDFKEKDRAE
ncbi:outer membrane beta-barrel family protein [Chryseobacterium gallinarum]|uniref:outer membrane beta-barrel family protein n=1 Tax=Chryseobacterium gallinarum TaxID=1324352 RepID=UPI0006A745C9|nr:outer membrane beta-barrel family protein [Chryseobacterium gallinarum]